MSVLNLTSSLNHFSKLVSILLIQLFVLTTTSGGGSVSSTKKSLKYSGPQLPPNTKIRRSTAVLVCPALFPGICPYAVITCRSSSFGLLLGTAAPFLALGCALSFVLTSNHLSSFLSRICTSEAYVKSRSHE